MSTDPGVMDDSAARISAAPRADAARIFAGDGTAAPLFILSPPRSFSSIVCAMVGQHPQMYGLPETNLFGAESVLDWRTQCSVASHRMDNGVLRTITELYFGGQTERTVALARGWLRRRSHFSTGRLLEEFAKRVHPRHLVDKSPSLVYRPDALQRVFGMFPRARFLHLLRHPRGQGASVMKRIRVGERRGKVAQWLTELASIAVGDGSNPAERGPDPQGGWYLLNRNICSFLESVPKGQWMRIQGEALITDPDRGLSDICRWMELRADAEAIDRMKHPEASPFSRIGPPGAELGNDIVFLHDPRLRSSRAEAQSLEGPLAWRLDGGSFSPLVKALAREFGYQ